ncbi:MAG: hypothetical protein IPJ41_16875 [Phycisphaerales bacterium]|nr:hypothetical protein [Phycisphaerales bacterium]
MIKAVIKQLPWMLALFVLGPIAGHLVGSLRASDGSGDTTLLTCTNPVMGAMAGLVTLVFAGAVGFFAARVNGCRSGLNAAGIVFAWAASQTTTIDAIIRRAQSPAPLSMLAIEGGAFCLLAAPVAAIIWRAGLGRGLHAAAHPLPDGSPNLGAWLTGAPKGPRGLLGESMSLSGSLARAMVRPAGWGAMGVTVVVGGVMCWLVAQDMLKGQVIFAAAMTGVLAVPVGRLAGESLKEQPPMAAFFVGIAVLAVAGPLATMFIQGKDIVALCYSGKLLGVAGPVTLDWAAGAFLGIPIGEAWFVSMFRQTLPEASGSAAR